TMGAPLRNDQHGSVIRRQFLGMPLEEGRRAVAQIDGNIPDTPSYTTHKFHFRMWRILEMHAPDGASLSRPREIDLDDAPSAKHCRQTLLAKKTRKRAPQIGVLRRLHPRNTSNRAWNNRHSMAHLIPAS